MMVHSGLVLVGLSIADAGCTNVAQRDCDGHDITSVDGYDLSDCCSACASTSGCGAYVFVKGGDWGNKCYLKSKCVPKSGCVGDECTAGEISIEPSPAPDPPTPTPPPSGHCEHYDITVSQDCDGNDLTDVEGYDTDDCCDACARTPGCGAYVFVKGGPFANRCYLKSKCIPAGGCAGDVCTVGVHSGPPAPPAPVPPTPGPSPLPSGLSVRVAKAMGRRGDKLRVSLVRQHGLSNESDFVHAASEWDYSGQFRHRWTGMHLSSRLVDIQPGVTKKLSLDGLEIDVRVPKANEGSVGLLIADPCLDQSQWCPYADTWNVESTLQDVLNSMANHGELDYWMNIGDLFYDQFGDTTARFFSGLNKNVQSAVHGVCFGNHDYWNNGDPDSAQDSDNFGNGLMQWYAQDAMSAQNDATQIFDFSADPDNYEVADYSNFFWYNMVGNVAFIGFSGQGTWKHQKKYFQEACSWARVQDPALLVLLGHWDGDDMGCANGMAASEVYDKVQSLSGCDALQGRIKYFEGHTHCNQIMEDNTGFMVGANGMSGCGDFGLPILDTRHGQETLWYFKLGSDGKRVRHWDVVLDCIRSKGFSSCTQYAEKWMTQSFWNRSRLIV